MEIYVVLDRIFIENLAVEASVGARKEERKSKQTIIVDAILFLDLSDAGISDDPRKTPSYTKIRDGISAFVSGGEFRLLEGLAQGIATLLLKNPKIFKVKIRVRKQKYAENPSIGVEITRRRA